jgi:hypothetical protein
MTGSGGKKEKKSDRSSPSYKANEKATLDGMKKKAMEAESELFSIGECK